MGLEDIKRLLKQKTRETETGLGAPQIINTPTITNKEKHDTAQRIGHRKETINIPPQLANVKPIMLNICNLTQNNKNWCNYIITSVENNWKTNPPPNPPSPEIIDLLRKIARLIPERIRTYLEKTYGIKIMTISHYDDLARQYATTFVRIAQQTLEKLEKQQNPREIKKTLKEIKKNLDQIKQLSPQTKEFVLRNLTTTLRKPRETVIEKIEKINNIVNKNPQQQEVKQLKTSLATLLGHTTTIQKTQQTQNLTKQAKTLKAGTSIVNNGDTTNLSRRLKKRIRLVS